MSTLIFEGALAKKGKINTAFKTRYMIMKKINNNTTILQYYDSKMGRTLLGTISLDDVYAIEVISDYDLKVEELPNHIIINTTMDLEKKWSFILDTRDRKYVLAAFNPPDFKSWLAILSKHIFGDIIKHGWLYKRGYIKNNWKQRYFMLNKRNIRYYEDFEQTKYLGTIDLNDVIDVNDGNKHDQNHKYIFELITNERIWILCAEDNKERDSWTHHITYSHQNRLSPNKHRRKTTDLSLNMQVALLHRRLDIKIRKRKLKNYPNCFLGCDAVKHIISLRLASNVNEAVLFGNLLMKKNIIRHIEKQQRFEDKNFLYQFTLRFKKSVLEDIDSKESIPLQLKAEMLEKRLDIRTRKLNFVNYADCFASSDAIRLIMKLSLAEDEKQAKVFGHRLMEHGLIEHVTNNGNDSFYRFTQKYDKMKRNETNASLQAHGDMVLMDMISDISSNQAADDNEEESKGKEQKTPSLTKRASTSLFGSLLKVLTPTSAVQENENLNESPYNLVTTEAKMNSLEDGDESFSQEDCWKIDDEKEYFVNECESLDSCVSLKRIIVALEFYKNHFEDEEEIYLFLASYKHLVNDFHHLLYRHLNFDTLSMSEIDEEYQIIYAMMMEIECVHCTKCQIFARNQSEREEDTIISHGFLIDILDNLHCTFLHSVDAGYKIMHSAIDQNDLFSLKEYQQNKRKSLIKIRGKDRFEKNKFVTNIDDESKLYFGQKYEFHSDLNGNKQKYDKLKTEITQNQLHSLELSSFDKVYKKALHLLNHSECVRRIKSVKFNFNQSGYKYNIESNAHLDILHIIAIILYTDYDSLSYSLKTNFGNSEFFIFGQKLVETVNCFGTSMDGTKLKFFYHSTTKQPFNSCLLALNCPISVTVSLSVQTLYAIEDGIILQLAMNENFADRSLRCFDCSLFSNRCYENERLFVNAPSDCYLRINSIFDMHSNEDYNLYIRAIAKFDEIMNGKRVKLNETDANILKDLCLMKSEIDIPQYIEESFYKWKQTKNKIIVDFKHLDEQIKRLFVCNDCDNLLAFYKINTLFESIREIECREIGDISSKYVVSFVSVLESLNALKHSRLSKIYLKGCDNVYLFFTNFCKFESALSQQKWRVERQETTLIISKFD